jgi:hypothetical protein
LKEKNTGLIENGGSLKANIELSFLFIHCGQRRRRISKCDKETLQGINLRDENFFNHFYSLQLLIKSRTAEILSLRSPRIK